MTSETPTTDAATHDDWSGGSAAVEVETAQEMEKIARSLMRTCYDEANRLANHGSNGLERLVMSQLYDAANDAKARLNTQGQTTANQ
jgi:hypothetical protein